MKARKNITLQRVATEFRDYIRVNNLNTGCSIEEVASDIRKAGEVYQQFEENRHPDGHTLWKRMKVMDVGTAMPVLLWLYTSDVPTEKRARSVRALESYLVRRMLCNIPTTGLNHAFISLLESLSREGPDRADDAVIDYLASRTVTNQIWPNNRILAERITTQPLGGLPVRQKMVSEAIEAELRGDKAEALGNTDNLTLEHIMPQHWETHWPLSRESSELTEIRSNAVKSLGNLTLVTGKLNSNLSNGPWAEKKKTLHAHSSLFLNKTPLDNAPEVWAEEAIQKRSKELAEIITKIWPHADGI